jgi:hypothetical protein
MQAHRVVRRGAESLEYLHFAARVDRGAEDDLLEKIRRDVLGAAKGEKQAAARQDLKPMKV